MTQLYANNATSTLASGITNVATSIPLAAGTGVKFPSPSGGDFFLATMFQYSGTTEINHEIVRVTARSTDTLTVTRAQEGTTGRAFNTGDPIQLRITSATMSSLAPLSGPTISGLIISNPTSGFLVSGAGVIGYRVTSTADGQAWAASNGWGYNQSAWSRTASTAGVMWGTGNNAGTFEVWITATTDPASTPPTDTNSRFKVSAAGVSDAKGELRTIIQNRQDVDYTLVLADAGKSIYHASPTAHTHTIPANASVAFPIGTAITFANGAGAGALTIAIATDTMRLAGSASVGSRILAAVGTATAIKVAATEWFISGAGLS